MSTLYTVQCGYWGHSGNVVEVHADTPEEACQKAIEAANGDHADGWTDAHGVSTDTHIDAICEGDEAKLWADGNPIGVPDEFKATTDQLAAALKEATKSLIAERDCQYESVATPSTGEVEDEDDARMLAEMDAEIDGYRAALERAGVTL